MTRTENEITAQEIVDRLVAEFHPLDGFNNRRIAKLIIMDVLEDTRINELPDG
jgi:hypothetical protein